MSWSQWGVDAVVLARAQFAFTMSFHIVFPAFSIGLASYLAVLEALWLWTGREVFLNLFHYWLTGIKCNEYTNASTTQMLDPVGRTAMLELIGRIGAEFGISIVVASHLLGEIERICDHLVAIDGGRLLRADSITSFTQASQVLAVEVEEGLAQLQAELAARGLSATPQAATSLAGTSQVRTLLVPLGGDDTYDVVRDCVAALALPLCRLEQRRHQVEELFRDGEEVQHA